MNENSNIYDLLNDISDELGKIGREKRIAWFDKTRYPYPVCFGREIDGTVYTVTPHFSGDAKESLREKVDRLLRQGG